MMLTIYDPKSKIILFLSEFWIISTYKAMFKQKKYQTSKMVEYEKASKQSKTVEKDY